MLEAELAAMQQALADAQLLAARKEDEVLSATARAEQVPPCRSQLMQTWPAALLLPLT